MFTSSAPCGTGNSNGAANWFAKISEAMLFDTLLIAGSVAVFMSSPEPGTGAATRRKLCVDLFFGDARREVRKGGV